MATVPHDAAQNSVVADSFDMSSLKASLDSGSAVTGACHHPRPQAKMPTIHREAAAPAERDVNAGASRGETKVGGGGEGGDDGGGWGGTSVAARAAAARGGPPPADEKENMDPVTGHVHGASTSPHRAPSRQPFGERQVTQPASDRRVLGNQLPGNVAAPQRKGLRAVVAGRGGIRPSMMR